MFRHSTYLSRLIIWQIAVNFANIYWLLVRVNLRDLVAEEVYLYGEGKEVDENTCSPQQGEVVLLVLTFKLPHGQVVE